MESSDGSAGFQIQAGRQIDRFPFAFPIFLVSFAIILVIGVNPESRFDLNLDSPGASNQRQIERNAE